MLLVWQRRLFKNYGMFILGLGIQKQRIFRALYSLAIFQICGIPFHLTTVTTDPRVCAIYLCSTHSGHDLCSDGVA
jgi:hypothetical protein